MTTIAESFTKSRDLAKNFPAYLKFSASCRPATELLFATSFLVNILISQFPAILAYTSKTIIDSLGANGPTPGSGGGSQAPIFLGGLYLGFFCWSNMLVRFVLLHVNETLTESSSKNIHVEIIKAAIRLEGLYYFENPNFHNRSALLERDALYIPMNFLRFFTDVCSITVTSLGMALLLFGLHPLIPFLIILCRSSRCSDAEKSTSSDL